MRRAPPRSGGGGAGDPRPGANAREQPAMLDLEDLAEAVQDAQNRSPLPSFVLPYGIGMTPDRVGELALRPGAPIRAIRLPIVLQRESWSGHGADRAPVLADLKRRFILTIHSFACYHGKSREDVLPDIPRPSSILNFGGLPRR